jgi:flagellar biosynthesis protein FlhG
MKIIAVTSGKGGVGKTTTACNLGVALADLGQRVLILDGDLGMANVDIFFGIKSIATIQDLLLGKPAADCITPVMKNLDLLAGGSGLIELTQVNAFQRRELLTQVQELQFRYDVVLVDTAPGLHEYVLHLNAVADDVLVVLTPDPASFADAYALIKVLNKRHKISEFKIMCNLIDEAAGRRLFVRFSEVVEKFLSIRLNYLTSLPQDGLLSKTQQLQRLIMRQSPQSSTCEIFRRLAKELVGEMQGVGTISTQTKVGEGIFRPVTGHA